MWSRASRRWRTDVRGGSFRCKGPTMRWCNAWRRSIPSWCGRNSSMTTRRRNMLFAARELMLDHCRRLASHWRLDPHRSSSCQSHRLVCWTTTTRMRATSAAK
jgi:hypothetical protein